MANICDQLLYITSDYVALYVFLIRNKVFKAYRWLRRSNRTIPPSRDLPLPYFDLGELCHRVFPYGFVITGECVYMTGLTR